MKTCEILSEKPLAPEAGARGFLRHGSSNANYRAAFEDVP
jgi:hypothetical protein